RSRPSPPTAPKRSAVALASPEEPQAEVCLNAQVLEIVEQERVGVVPERAGADEHAVRVRTLAEGLIDEKRAVDREGVAEAVLAEHARIEVLLGEGPVARSGRRGRSRGRGVAAPRELVVRDAALDVHDEHPAQEPIEGDVTAVARVEGA